MPSSSPLFRLSCTGHTLSYLTIRLDPTRDPSDQTPLLPYPLAHHVIHFILPTCKWSSIMYLEFSQFIGCLRNSSLIQQFVLRNLTVIKVNATKRQFVPQFFQISNYNSMQKRLCTRVTSISSSWGEMWTHASIGSIWPKKRYAQAGRHFCFPIQQRRLAGKPNGAV